MGIDIKVAQFPESVTEGTLIEWHKQPGEPVHQDDLLAEIETDKVVFEVLAPDDGIMGELLSREGDTVSSEQVIAHLQPAEVTDLSQAAQTASAPPATDQCGYLAHRPGGQKTDCRKQPGSTTHSG